MYEIGFKNGSKIKVTDSVVKVLNKSINSQNIPQYLKINDSNNELYFYILPNELIYITRVEEDIEEDAETETIICPNCELDISDEIQIYDEDDRLNFENNCPHCGCKFSVRMDTKIVYITTEI